MTNKTNTTQGFVKNNKPKKLVFKKKVIAAILALGMAFGMGATLTACDPKEPTPPVTIENVTQLVEDYDEQTDKFLNNEVLEDAVKFSTGTFNEENLIDATYDLGDGSKKSLDSVKVIFTYKDGNERLYNVNEMTFEESIALDLIANYEQNQDKFDEITNNAEVTNNYTTTYNSIESAQNDKLAEAIFEKVVKSSDKATHLTLKNKGLISYPIEGGILRFDCNSYDLIAQTGKTVKSYDILVKSKSNIDDMIASLTDSKNYKLRETRDIENIETPVVYKEYQKEDVEVPPVTEEIDKVDELFKTTLPRLKHS